MSEEISLQLSNGVGCKIEESLKYFRQKRDEYDAGRKRLTAVNHTLLVLINLLSASSLIANLFLISFHITPIVIGLINGVMHSVVGLVYSFEKLFKVTERKENYSKCESLCSESIDNLEGWLWLQNADDKPSVAVMLREVEQFKIKLNIIAMPL